LYLLFVVDFFSPANVQKLVEVVKGRHTDFAVVDTCLKLSHRLAKVGVVSGNCPGFIGNRMLAPYKEEAVFLVEDGATPEQVDRALKQKVGLAMGLFEV
jgi:3-hydroxyacyl-CoA dehydrogenase